MRRLSLSVLAALLAFPCIVRAQPGVIVEAPVQGETVSGVYVIRFIDCNGIIDSFSLDDSSNTLQFATGLSRGDAATFCDGNTDVGGASIFNWGLVPPGEHTVHFRDAENNIVTSQAVNVVNFGEEFKTMFNPLAIIMQNQPMDDMTTELRFSVPAQGWQAVAIRLDSDPNPSDSEIITLFQSQAVTLTITNPDRSTETSNYLFDRVTTSTSGHIEIVDDVNSAAVSNSIQAFFLGTSWSPSRPFSFIDSRNCWYASFSQPLTTGVAQLLLEGALLRGRQNDEGRCAVPLLNVIDAKQVLLEIGSPSAQ
jgi:hypothetical protein